MTVRFPSWGAVPPGLVLGLVHGPQQGTVSSVYLPVCLSRTRFIPVVSLALALSIYSPEGTHV